MNAPWAAAGGVALLLVASMALLGGRLAGEAARKLLHVEMGLVTLSFPWLFDSAWQVLALGAVSVAWFAALRACPRLGASFGAALYGCARRSAGEIWFVCGVAAAFVLAGDEPLVYCTAILVLTVADAAAALAGRRFGRPLRLPGGAVKSAAGCCACFGAALAVTTGALALAMPLADALRVALAVAAAASLAEALLGGGADNLGIPLASVAVLEACT